MSQRYHPLAGAMALVILATTSLSAQGRGAPSGGGTATALTQSSGVALNFQPRISPDGKTIAFKTSDRSRSVSSLIRWCSIAIRSRTSRAPSI